MVCRQRYLENQPPLRLSICLLRLSFTLTNRTSPSPISRPRLATKSGTLIRMPFVVEVRDLSYLCSASLKDVISLSPLLSACFHPREGSIALLSSMPTPLWSLWSHISSNIVCITSFLHESASHMAQSASLGGSATRVGNDLNDNGSVSVFGTPGDACSSCRPSLRPGSGFLATHRQQRELGGLARYRLHEHEISIANARSESVMGLPCWAGAR